MNQQRRTSPVTAQAPKGHGCPIAEAKQPFTCSPFLESCLLGHESCQVSGSTGNPAFIYTLRCEAKLF